MKLTERAAHLMGLAEGLDYDKTTKEGRLIAALIELTEALADKVQGLEHDLEELSDCVDTIGEEFSDFLSEYEDGEDEDACDGDCAACDAADECEYADDDTETYEVECPACGETICFDETIDPSDLICPSCGKRISCKGGEPAVKDEPEEAPKTGGKGKTRKTTK